MRRISFNWAGVNLAAVSLIASKAAFVGAKSVMSFNPTASVRLAALIAPKREVRPASVAISTKVLRGGPWSGVCWAMTADKARARVEKRRITIAI